MITASIIYTIITILLAGVDAIRIYFARKAGKENIEHIVGDMLAIGFGFGVYVYWHETHLTGFSDIGYFIAFLILGISFIAIRFTIYDIVLNLLRGRKIDYVSTKTSSWEDGHIRFAFWLKRLIGAGGWLVMFGLYKIIFKQ